MKNMARTYRKIAESKQNPKRRKSKKNKASWKAFREQHHHAKQMVASQDMNIATLV